MPKCQSLLCYRSANSRLQPKLNQPSSNTKPVFDTNSEKLNMGDDGYPIFEDNAMNDQGISLFSEEIVVDHTQVTQLVTKNVLAKTENLRSEFESMHERKDLSSTYKANGISIDDHESDDKSNSDSDFNDNTVSKKPAAKKRKKRSVTPTTASNSTHQKLTNNPDRNTQRKKWNKIDAEAVYNPSELEVIKQSNGRLLCHCCSRDFRDIWYLDRHQRSLHPIYFSRRKSMPQKPKAKRNQKEKYPCRLCTLSFAYAGKLADHVKSKHPAPVDKKDLAHQESNPACDDYEEIEFDEMNKTYICRECGYSSSRAAAITSHVDAVHRKTIAAECNICGKQFLHKHALKRHMYLHTEMPYKCNVCERGFPDRYKLFEVHMKKHHPDEYQQEMNSRNIDREEENLGLVLGMGLPTMNYK